MNVVAIPGKGLNFFFNKGKLTRKNSYAFQLLSLIHIISTNDTNLWLQKTFEIMNNCKNQLNAQFN